VRAPKRKREAPRTICRAIPRDVNLSDLAQRLAYVGSPEHKSYPTSSGPPRLRADASKCDPSFKNRVQEIENSLRAAVRSGQVGGPWENGLPRYAWNRLDGVCFEARLVNAESGAYKGYPLSAEEAPEGLEERC